MASTSEYEQQQFWEDKPNITPGISGTTFKLIIKENWFMNGNIFEWTNPLLEQFKTTNGK